MNNTASKWTNGINLSLGKKDQEYIIAVLKELGVENDYPVVKKSIGIIKVGFAEGVTDNMLIALKEEVAPLLKKLLPLELTSKEVKIITPWNTQLGEIAWFEINLDNDASGRIESVRKELSELLEPIMHETNKERNKEFKPHLTLIYKLDAETKEKIDKKISEEASGESFEEKLNNFLKMKGFLPYKFTLEHAEFYLEGDEREVIL